jgi:hypothetical protein
LNKLIKLFCITALIFILTGCNQPFDYSHFKEMIEEVNADKELSKHLESFDYTEKEHSIDEEKEYFAFDLTGELKDSFDSLSSKDQYEFLASIVKTAQKHGGDPEGDRSEFECGDLYECEIALIDLQTTHHHYSVEYSPYRKSSFLFKDTEKIYNADSNNEVKTHQLKETGKPAEESDEIESEDTMDTEKAADEENENQLSEEFAEYNSKYYTGFKNQLDLIGSNFELIYDGYRTSALTSDLIRWTIEFDELLDVYEQNAQPLNEMDEELFSITRDMITNQREANQRIIKGLEESDDLSLVIAGEYIESVADLYIEGNEYLEK